MDDVKSNHSDMLSDLKNLRRDVDSMRVQLINVENLANVKHAALAQNPEAIPTYKSETVHLE